MSTQNAAGEDLVLLEVQDGVAVVTLNRPEALNAMNTPVQRRLRAVLEQLETDDAVDVVILTGAGEKSFVAGADIKELARRNPMDGLRAYMQRLYDDIAAYPKPTVAAVNGFAFGGGCELAMACDVRIASENARFALPETGLGIIPSAGGTQRLARLVGVGRATDMIITGRRLTAEQAEAWGLVTDVVPAGQLLEKAREVAGRIRSKGPLAVNIARTLVRRSHDVDQATGMLLERLGQSLIFASDEKQEGTAAFVESRAADFHSVHHSRVQASDPSDGPLRIL